MPRVLAIISFCLVSASAHADWSAANLQVTEAAKSPQVAAVLAAADRVDAAIVAVLQVGVLIPLHEQLIVVIDHQPQHRALELIEGWLTGSAHPHVGGTPVEAVERIVDLCVDAGGGPGIPPDVDDRQTLHNASLNRDRNVVTVSASPYGAVPVNMNRLALGVGGAGNSLLES